MPRQDGGPRKPGSGPGGATSMSEDEKPQYVGDSFYLDFPEPVGCGSG